MTARITSVNRRIVFAIAAGWGSKAVSILVNLVQIPLLYRYLDKEIIGVWFLMIGAQMLLGLFDFGFGQTLQRRIAFAKGNCGSCPDTVLTESAKQDIRNLLAVARRVYHIISLIVLLVLLIGGPLYFSTLKLSPAAASSLRIAWIIMAIGYSANMWGAFVESTLNGLGDVGWSNIVSSVLWILVLAATWAVLASGGGLLALGLIWVLRGISLRIAGWTIVRRRHPWLSEKEGHWLADTFETMLHPSFQWWIAIIGTFLLNGISRYFIGSYLGTAVVADYVATYTALVTLQGITGSLVGVTTPLLSQMWKAGDLESMRRYVFRFTRLGLILTVISYAFICIYGKEIFELWLGKGHFVGYQILVTLSVMMLFEVHHGMLNIPCIAAEKLQFYKYTLLSGFINTGLIVILIQRWELLGIAASVLIANLVTNNWIIPMISLHLLGYTIQRYLYSVILPVLGAGVFAIVVALALGRVFPNFILSALAYCLLVGSVLVFSRKRLLYSSAGTMTEYSKELS